MKTDTPEETEQFLFILLSAFFLEEGKTALFGNPLAREFTQSTGALDVLVGRFHQANVH